MRQPRFLNSIFSVAVGVLAAGPLFFTAATDGHAAFKLRLTSGLDTVIVSDNNVAGQASAVPNTADADAAVGFISFSGPVGSFSTVISIGISKPNTGAIGTPLIKFFNLDVSSNSAGTLVVELTDTEFAGGTGRFVTEISDLDTTGTVAVTSAVDIANAEFAAVQQVGDIAAVGPASGFSGKVTGNAPIDADYSVSILSTITHGGGGFELTQFNTTVSVPEPRTLALFGIGLLGLGMLARRRARPRAWAA